MAEKPVEQAEFNFIGLGDTTRRLGDYQDEIVTVEICCCGTLKKVTGCLNLIGRDFIEITGPGGGPVDIQIFCSEECTFIPEPLPFTQSQTIQGPTQVLIPRDKICAIECLTCGCHPCGPCKGKRHHSKTEETKEE